MSRRRRRRRRRTRTSNGLGPIPLTATGNLSGRVGGGGLLQADSVREVDNSWWSQRWIEAVEAFGGLGNFNKGRNQAKKESVLAIHIEAGLVLAQVQSGKGDPYIVRFDLPQLTSEKWEEVITDMSQQAVFTAKLLAGELPEETEDAFSEADASLLPGSLEEIPASCTCGDPNVPCRHIAAAHYMLAEEFGKNPFLIFKLRGCPRDRLLTALRHKRSGSPDAPLPDDAAEELAEESLSPQEFWHAGEGLEKFAINIAPPLRHAGLLRQLGSPPIEEGEAFIELMSSIYENVMGSVLVDALKGHRPDDAAEARNGTPSAGRKK